MGCTFIEWRKVAHVHSDVFGARLPSPSSSRAADVAAVLNVIALFTKATPLIAIQHRALDRGG